MDLTFDEIDFDVGDIPTPSFGGPEPSSADESDSSFDLPVEVSQVPDSMGPSAPDPTLEEVDF